MRHVLATALGVWLTLAGASAQTFYSTVTETNLTAATTNTLVSTPVLRGAGEDVGVTLSVASPAGHNNVTVTAYYQFTADGTNWTATNASFALAAITTLGTTNVTAGTNFSMKGWSAVRVGGMIASSTTNTTVLNALGTWR